MSGAVCFFFNQLTDSTNRALCNILCLWGCVAFCIRKQTEGINQEKRLLCQAATMWWSTYCQPCLHILACSVVKVGLTLMLSFMQCIALTSHDSKNSGSYTVGHLLSSDTYTVTACMNRDTAHRAFLRWEKEETRPSLKSSPGGYLILCNHASLHIPVYTELSHLIRNNSVHSLMPLHI